MTINTYATLKTAVANWLGGRSDLTSRIPEFIELAEDRIAHDLRVRAMETSADVTISARTASLPTSFLQMRRLYLNVTDVPALEYVSPDNYWKKWGSATSGQPQIYTIEGENLVFAPTPDSTYTGKALYYKRFTALSSDSDDNWILTNARGLYLYGALLEAAPFIRNDPRLAIWSSMFDNTLDRVMAADMRDRHPSTLVQHPSFVPA